MELNLLTLLWGTLLGGVVLFVWSGITQNLPWGFKSVATVTEAPKLSEAIRQQTTDGMFYSTDGTSSLVVVKPQSYYNPTRYFILEILTQFGVALLFTLILSLLSPLGSTPKLAVVGLMGVTTALAVDFQYWNWWGFSSRYSLGMALNRLVGWLTTAWVLDRFVV